MNHKTKIIIIGLDGATWQVLRPLIEKGELPAFKKIIDKGVYGNLLSTVPCRSAVAIATFYTGKNPCKWGMLDFPCFDADAMAHEKIKSKAQSLWDILGKHGYKSAILNLPVTYPPTQTNGVMVSGFPPSEEEDYTYPKDFKEKIKGFHAKRGEFLDSIFRFNYENRTAKDEEDLFNFYLKNAKERYELIKNVIKDKAFNFSIFWLDEPDSVQHIFWGKEKFLLAFFREIDNMLEDIRGQNPDADIVIISDHGFDARPIYEFYPKTWLKKENYLRLKGGRVQQWIIQKINNFAVGIHPRERYKYLERFYSAYNFILKSISRIHKKEKKEVAAKNRNWRLVGENRVGTKAIGIDWKKTIATNHDFWGIRIIRENLNRDYEEVRKEIMEKMKQLSDESGEKIIKDVWKREELFWGKDIQKFPDIVYLPQSKYEPTGFLPSQIIKKKPAPLRPGGDHVTVREGVFIAAGPNINNAGEIGAINMVDIAPTILEAFGVPIPEEMDGQVLKEILNL